MAEIKVSVIIPFYDRVDWLKEAVDSVLNQSFRSFEVIVINDGSKEDISSFCDEYQHKIIYKWKENGGAATARNLGIDIAKGEYIAFLDSDDIWDSHKLKRQVELMDGSKAIWSHSYWAYFISDDPENLRKTFGSETQNNNYPGSLASMNIATPCVMIRTDFLKEKKHFRFHESMRFGQDTYLWLLLSAKQDILCIPEVLCKVRHRGSNTARKARAHIQTRALIWKYLRHEPDSMFYRNRNLAGIRGIYRLCLLEHRFLLWIEKKAILNQPAIELLARIIYAIPYFGFKFYKRKLK